MPARPVDPAAVMTPRARLATVPNQPKTPRRTVRIDDNLWEAAGAKAEAEGTTVSVVIRDALKRYVKRK